MDKQSISKWQLYKLLRRNESLKDERHPMFEKNRFMKFLGAFMFLYYAAILLLLGVTLPMGMRGKYCDVAAFHVFDGYFLWVLFCDFWVRFILQETPAQQAKPYTLMPIRRSFLMNIYLLRNMLSFGNLFWGCLLVPFGFLAVWPILGFGGCVSWLMGWWLMIVADGLAYLFVRALCIKHLGWIAIPVAIHGALIALMVLPNHNPLDMPCTKFLYAFALCDVWPYLLMAAIIALFYFANYRLQMGMVHDEVGKKEEVKVKATTQMNYLNRFGKMGEYLKMEMKLRTRNKQVRIQFFTLLGLTAMLCGIQYFSNIYDGSFMTSFICLYAYIAIGGTSLVTIMGYEGNYIDGLLSRRESIYELLRAKYYFNSLILLVPFCLLVPLMIIGKQSPWMNLAYLSFTVGILYMGLFQLAVYNKDSIPMNRKMTGKQGNMMQQIVSIVMIFLPVAIERIGAITMGETPTYIMMTLLGLAGICTHKLWIKNIYKRYMQRRHSILEGMRASRNS